jgi:hypothetical protein
MLNFFPLLSIPVLIYNVIALGGGVFSRSSTDVVSGFSRSLLGVPMASGAVWAITAGDVVLMLALVLLFAELVKTANQGRDMALNRTLSLALFIVCLLEFILLPAFASTLFFVLTIMTLFDVIAGYMLNTTPAYADDDYDADDVYEEDDLD